MSVPHVAHTKPLNRTQDLTESRGRLVSHAGVFRGPRLSSLVGRDGRRAPLKTPVWEGSGRCTVTIPVFNSSVKRFWLNTVLNAEARLTDQWSLNSAWCGTSLLSATSGCKFIGFIIFLYVFKHATSLVTWIHTVCRAYETFYINEPPSPTQLLEQALRLILHENSFQFNGKNYLQTHGTAMGTKMAVAFSNTAISRKVVGKSAHNNPERYCGWFWVQEIWKNGAGGTTRTYVCEC